MHNPQPPRRTRLYWVTRDQPKMPDDFQPNLALARFKDSQLWIHLQSFERPELATTVSIIATSAQVLLEQVARHMPLYTLHNERHILNVIGWMDWLIEESIARLSSIDCTLLLLAAYCHDLGMALDDAEHRELLDETAPTPTRVAFDAFVDGHGEERHQISKLRKEGYISQPASSRITWSLNTSGILTPRAR